MPTNFGWNHNKKKSDWMSENPTEPINISEEAMWELLSAYVDGEVTPEEARQVEAMLQSDPAYARDFSFLKAASQSVHALQEVEPPAALRQSILMATTRRRTLAERVAAAWSASRTAYLPSFGRYALPGAGALAVAVLAAFVLWPRPTAPNTLAQNAPFLQPLPPTGSEGSERLNPEDRHKLEIYTGAAQPVRKRNTPDLATGKHLAMAVKPKAATPVSTDRVLQALRVAFAPSALHKSVDSKKRMVNRTLRHTPVQKPVVVADVEPGSFYARPMMDAENYHPTNVEKTEQKGIEGPDVRTEDDASIKLTSATENEAAVVQDATVPPPTPSPRIRVARLLASQTPPDSRHILTGADIKRIRDASMLGYDTQTVESIQRKQPTIAFVSRF